MVTVGVAAGRRPVTATDPGELSATQMFDVTVAVAVANQAPLWLPASPPRGRVGQLQ